MSCSRKRRRITTRRVSLEEQQERVDDYDDDDSFDKLPDDLVICVLAKLCQSSTCPSDFINALTVCKRFNQLGTNRLVLSSASPKLFSIKAKNWSDSSHEFVKLCVNAGSVEACYFLGMIRFYCLGNRGTGASLMAKSAMRAHAPSLYALAVIQFNGSGGTKSDKDLRAGAALCARAAFLGHVDAMRELGHCLQDGYGVRRNVTEGRRLLVQANALELASAVAPPVKQQRRRCGGRRKRRRDEEIVVRMCGTEEGGGETTGGCCALLSDFGCDVPVQEPHPVNRFLVEWFDGNRLEPDGGLRMCSNPGCGRPEIRAHEFRRCSVCGRVNYCSRGCQAHDWKLRHKGECRREEEEQQMWVVNGGQQGGGGEVLIGDGGGGGGRGGAGQHQVIMLGS